MLGMRIWARGLPFRCACMGRESRGGERDAQSGSSPTGPELRPTLNDLEFEAAGAESEGEAVQHTPLIPENGQRLRNRSPTKKVAPLASPVFRRTGEFSMASSPLPAREVGRKRYEVSDENCNRFDIPNALSPAQMDQL